VESFVEVCQTHCRLEGKCISQIVEFTNLNLKLNGIGICLKQMYCDVKRFMELPTLEGKKLAIKLSEMQHQMQLLPVLFALSVLKN
jgi:hypothetical protein